MSRQNELNFELLPDLPQAVFLKRLAPRLWQESDVVALWVGGSLASGRADAYSDVDLRVAVTSEGLAEWWEPDFEALFEGLCLSGMFMRFGEGSLLHHLILSSGEIYDLYVQRVDYPLTEECRLVLGCRDEQLREKLEGGQEVPIERLPADALLIRRLLEGYWLHTHKHQKVLFRGLDLLLYEGINRMRPILLRLYYILATGKDCGDLRCMTIHTMTPVVKVIQQTYGDQPLKLVGLPMRSPAEISIAIERLNRAVSEVGRQVAEKFEVEYPSELESMVRRSWAEFKKNEL